MYIKIIFFYTFFYGADLVLANCPKKSNIVPPLHV